MNYVFKTADHPEVLRDGEEFEYEQHVGTDEGGLVRIRMGRKTLIGLMATMLRMMYDDHRLLADARKMARTIKRT